MNKVKIHKAIIIEKLLWYVGERNKAQQYVYLERPGEHDKIEFGLPHPQREHREQALPHLDQYIC
jgi:hypothetical protein